MSAPGACDHSDVSVEYQTSVFVRVTDGAVGSVNVDDENIGEPVGAYCQICGAEGKAVQGAVDIATGDTSWPSWDFGF
jgi:hypothetical protein